MQLKNQKYYYRHFHRLNLGGRLVMLRVRPHQQLLELNFRDLLGSQMLQLLRHHHRHHLRLVHHRHHLQQLIHQLVEYQLVLRMLLNQLK
jgi:hypothetical protein